MIANLIASIDDVNEWNPVVRVDMIDLLLRDQLRRLVDDVFDGYRATRLPAVRTRGHLALLPDPSDLLA